MYLRIFLEAEMPQTLDIRETLTAQHRVSLKSWTAIFEIGILLAA